MFTPAEQDLYTLYYIGTVLLTILSLNSYPILVLLSAPLLLGTTVPVPARIFYRPVRTTCRSALFYSFLIGQLSL
jgi:hypothetical protein